MEEMKVTNQAPLGRDGCLSEGKERERSERIRLQNIDIGER
jgi:hypothetical protein